MIHFPRLVPIALTLSTVALVPQARAANNDAMQMVSLFQGPDGYLLHGAQGYLGVGIRDVDSDRASALKLKQPQGAEIVYLDQDAPASKAGLKVHDVILQMNGQQVEGVEQLRRMLHETPPGRSVSFIISRDGQTQNINLQLADRAKLEQDVRSKMFIVPAPEDLATFDSMVRQRPNGASSFLGTGPMVSRLDAGVDLHPINPQLAEYFGDKEGSGLLVESIEDNSPAAVAGLKVGDVIVKVNDDVVGTRGEWLRAIHANRGKSVQVTVLRNKHEQVLTMQAGDSKKKSELETLPFSDSDSPTVAELRRQLDSLNSGPLRDQLDSLNSGELRDELNMLGADRLKVGADAELQTKQAQAMAEQARKMMKSFDGKKLQEQMKKGQEDMRKSMDLWQQSLQTLDDDELD
jgi:serine protease Do